MNSRQRLEQQWNVNVKYVFKEHQSLRSDLTSRLSRLGLHVGNHVSFHKTIEEYFDFGKRERDNPLEKIVREGQTWKRWQACRDV